MPPKAQVKNLLRATLLGNETELDA